MEGGGLRLEPNPQARRGRRRGEEERRGRREKAQAELGGLKFRLVRGPIDDPLGG